jgi:serpin B
VHLVLFVPKPGKSLADLEGTSLAAEAKALTSAAIAASTDVALTLPRFKFTIDSTSLANPLIALGLVDAFANAADFSGITKQYPIKILDVFHKAMIGVKETGLEAAAATAVIFGDASVSLVDAGATEVKADRPFFFGIYDKPTATWLFLGHVVDPSQGDPP